MLEQKMSDLNLAEGDKEAFYFFRDVANHAVALLKQIQESLPPIANSQVASLLKGDVPKGVRLSGEQQKMISPKQGELKTGPTYQGKGISSL